RDPGMEYLHHTDIVTYALTRLASEYARDKVETLNDLRRHTQNTQRDDSMLLHLPEGPARLSTSGPEDRGPDTIQK
ncbi:MAG TPA: hypothetical protein VN670_05330, partial [Acidobacteriaceae bacterium]|nr:hypothetical protein [Acidobacteriaceae bacterium]